MEATQISQVTIPFIAGDGIGPEVMSAAQLIIDHAVITAYKGDKKIVWLEKPAGKSAFEATGEWLPVETLAALKEHRVSLKGPLATPVGEGIRSLNVYLRQELDLYVCLRQARWFEGLPSPHRNPQGIDITIFRENTEDIYIGIEYQAGTPENRGFLEGFKHNQPADYAKLPNPEECGIGIKPISKHGSQRLVKAAMQWALDNHKQRLTLAHKGNIMKFTEGAFRTWGYEVIENEFITEAFSRRQFLEIGKSQGEAAAQAAKQQALSDGKLWADDVIADVVFEQLITTPQQFDVIATTNLNGDYISDAAASLAGGVGISPGANINYETGTAVFEANHGSAEELAGKNLANPSSLILSGEMMLRYLGWPESADLVRRGIEETIHARKVTFDLARQIEGAQTMGTREFAQSVINNI